MNKLLLYPLLLLPLSLLHGAYTAHEAEEPPTILLRPGDELLLEVRPFAYCKVTAEGKHYKTLVPLLSIVAGLLFLMLLYVSLPLCRGCCG